MAIEVRRLLPSDDRSGFRSGNADLDRFLQKYAAQNQFRHHIGTTYVAIDGADIVGFATVAPAHIEIEHLPEPRRRRLPRYPLPVLRLARLAVDERAQGGGVGRLLLRAVFALARELARSVGCIGVVVDAKESAAAFYEKLGFERLTVLEGTLGDRPEPTAMFVPIDAIPAP